MNKHLEINEPILPGSISTAKSQCGKERYSCKKARSPELHGVYYRWTGFIDGKRTTKTVSKDVALECKRRIKNFRRLQNEILGLLREALANAPWPALTSLGVSGCNLGSEGMAALGRRKDLREICVADNDLFSGEVEIWTDWDGTVVGEGLRSLSNDEIKSRFFANSDARVSWRW